MAVTSEIEQVLRRQNAPASHLLRVRDLVQVVQADPAVIGMCLVGSYAKGTGDRVSDLDLVTLVDAGAEQHVLENLHARLDSSEVLHQFTGQHAGGGGFWKIVYLDFSSVECHVFGPGAGFRLRLPYLPLWDPKGRLPEYVVPGPPIQHKDFAAYDFGDTGLLWELIDCVKWLSRGDAELARAHIMKIASAINRGGGGAV